MTEACGLENRLEISRSSPAASYIPKEGLPKSHPLSQSLNRLRDNPHPRDNDLVVERHMPPITLYVFNDGNYSIAYSLSYLPDKGIDLISIYSIRPVT